MNLKAPNGSSFRLKLVGYQYPEITNDEFDSNWLNVRIDVTLPMGSWSATAPALLAQEVQLLADWLDYVAARTQNEDETGFTEPNLWFKIIRHANENRILRVHFEIEYRPPWARSHVFGIDEYFAEFALSDADLHQAATSLRTQLAQYPPRLAS